MKRISQVLFISVLFATGFADAQSIDQMIKDWSRAKAYTKTYLDAMPEDGYSFRPTADMRTFAEQMLHFTDSNYELAQLAGGIKSPIEDGACSKAADKSKSATIRMVMAGYDFVIANIKNLKPEQLSDHIKVFDKYDMTKELLLSKIFEHQTHHRGQTTVYFHLKGVKVPDQMLFDN